MVLTSISHGSSTTNLGKESGKLHHPALYIKYKQSFQRIMDVMFPSRSRTPHNSFQKL